MRPVEILLVEDNPADVRLTMEAMRDSRFPNRLRVVRDGAAAISYLERNTQEGMRNIPDLVLLDLNLPMMNGHEVLQRIKADARWKMIPVVVLTTSASTNDISTCYAHYANCYITKPLAFDAFMDVVEKIEDFWLSTVQLPRH